ncbi:MAG TPA: hypothetical protein VN780_14740 [Candidatus Eisenbacteria bacterium]|jgi:hypothetical protein|nr:hypothetical protein [Candidatus Eisenbacteria bacterium]
MRRDAKQARSWGRGSCAIGVCRRWSGFGGVAVALAGEIEDDPGNLVVQLLLDGALVFHGGAQCEIAGIDKDGGAARGNAALGQQANDVEDEGVDVLKAEKFREVVSNSAETSAESP